MKSFLCFFLKYDYGIPERGDSLEKKYFWPAILKLSPDSEVHWLEDIGFLDSRKDLLQNNIVEISKNKTHAFAFFVLMNDEVSFDTLEHLKKNKYKVINWFSDDHWRFDDWSVKLAHYLDYALTVDKYSAWKYEEFSNCKPIVTQWGTFEKHNFDPDSIGQEFTYDISFVGGKNPVREWFISHLEKFGGHHIECFGSGWENGRISNQEMNEVFLKSKINLNLSNSLPTDIRFMKFLIIRLLKSLLRLNFSNFKIYKTSLKNFLLRKEKSHEQMKARNFEIPAVGGLQLSHYTLELEDYFNIGEEVMIYSNVDELVKQVDFILNNNVVASKIRKLGFERSKNQSFFERIKKIVNQLNAH